MLVLLRKEHHNPLNLQNMSLQPQSRLLSLPAELRNSIWEELLIQQNDESQKNGRNERFCANILHTCKQIHAETLPILYGENTFLAHPSLLTSLPSFLLSTRPSRATLPPVTHPRLLSYIRKFYIHVRLDTDPRFSATQATEAFTGVDELELEVFQAMYGSCDFSVLKLFEGVRGVGKVVVWGSVGDGKYAEWLAGAMMSPPGTERGRFEERYVGGDKGWDAWTHGNR